MKYEYVPLDDYDINPVNQLSDDECLYIIEKCEKLDQVWHHISLKPDSGFELVEQLKDKTNSLTAELTLTNYNVSQSFSESISGAPSLPIAVLWCLAGLSSVGVLTLTIVSAGLTLMGFLAAGVYFWATYQELQKSKKDTEETILLLALQKACAEKLCRELPQPTKYNNVPAPAYNKIKSALTGMLIVSSALLGTYFIAANAVLAAIGLTLIASAMGAPWLLGAAVFISIAIGIYYGYKQYRLVEHEETVKKYIDDTRRDINDMRDNLKKDENPVKNVNTNAHSNDHVMWMMKRSQSHDNLLNHSKKKHFVGGVWKMPHTIQSSKKPKETLSNGRKHN